jgi:hypothetical protein
MVFKFIRDQYPQARFKRIYDADTDGWKKDDFHRSCNYKGWTLTIVKTTFDFVFGGFTKAPWESSSIYHTDQHSFMFSVNEGSKYPITGGDRLAIGCYSGYCALFGANGDEVTIMSDSNINNDSWCKADLPSFKLPVGKGQGFEKDSSSINGGKVNF